MKVEAYHYPEIKIKQINDSNNEALSSTKPNDCVAIDKYAYYNITIYYML